MRKLLFGLAALPLIVSVANAGERLTNQQMDGVTAGFSAISIADAEGLVGESGVVLTTTASLSQVLPFATAQCASCETSSTLFKSLSASQSSTVTSTITPSVIPTLGQ